MKIVAVLIVPTLRIIMNSSNYYKDRENKSPCVIHRLCTNYVHLAAETQTFFIYNAGNWEFLRDFYLRTLKGMGNKEY